MLPLMTKNLYRTKTAGRMKFDFCIILCRTASLLYAVSQLEQTKLSPSHQSSRCLTDEWDVAPSLFNQHSQTWTLWLLYCQESHLLSLYVPWADHFYNQFSFPDGVFKFYNKSQSFQLSVKNIEKYLKSNPNGTGHLDDDQVLKLPLFVLCPAE